VHRVIDFVKKRAQSYEGDHVNAVLSAAGYNFDLLLRWLAAPLRALIRVIELSLQSTQITEIRRRADSSRTLFQQSSIDRFRAYSSPATGCRRRHRYRNLNSGEAPRKYKSGVRH